MFAVVEFPAPSEVQELETWVEAQLKDRPAVRISALAVEAREEWRCRGAVATDLLLQELLVRTIRTIALRIAKRKPTTRVKSGFVLDEKVMEAKGREMVKRWAQAAARRNLSPAMTPVRVNGSDAPLEDGRAKL